MSESKKRKSGTGRRRGQRGAGRETQRLLEAISGIVSGIQPVSVRGVAYKMFAAGLGLEQKR